jgi:hypothetical protein
MKPARLMLKLRKCIWMAFHERAVNNKLRKCFSVDRQEREMNLTIKSAKEKGN